MRLLILCWIGLTGLARAEGSVTEWFRQLNSERWEEREIAEGRLLQAEGAERAEVLAQGVDVLAREDAEQNPEVSQRTYRVLRSLKLRDLQGNSSGFLGVGLRDAGVELSIEGEQFLPIEISYVMPNTAAQAEDVRMGHYILKVDGISCGPEFRTPELIEHIRARKPGDQITVLFWFADEQFEKTIILGVRPAMAGEPSELARREQRFRSWLEEELRAARTRLKSPAEEIP